MQHICKIVNHIWILDLHKRIEKHTERVEPLLRIGVALRAGHDGFVNMAVHCSTVQRNTTRYSTAEHNINAMQCKEVLQFNNVESNSV